jgi:hypothetical protein
VPEGNTLGGVWGDGKGTLFAVGSGTLLTWNGSTCSASFVSGSFGDVWGSSASDVWAVGQDGAIAHWDGAAWSSSNSGTTSSLYAVWGS